MCVCFRERVRMYVCLCALVCVWAGGGGRVHRWKWKGRRERRSRPRRKSHLAVGAAACGLAHGVGAEVVRSLSLTLLAGVTATGTRRNSLTLHTFAVR